jgi:hypothetical protein
MPMGYVEQFGLRHRMKEDETTFTGIEGKAEQSLGLLESIPVELNGAKSLVTFHVSATTGLQGPLLSNQWANAAKPVIDYTTRTMTFPGDYFA